MINTDSLAAVAESQWTSAFLRPRYDAYGFAALPRLIPALLGAAPLDGDAAALGPLAETYDQVILLLLDGFGWSYYARWADSFPFLSRFARDGVVAQITSQFPSTTATHLTCIHSGLPVGQSGVYEWFYYEPQLDAMIAPLLFSFAGDVQRDTLRRTRIAPAALYPTDTLYRRLQARGVAAHIYQHQDYTPTTYSEVLFAGAHVVPYKTLPEALTALDLTLQAATGPAYHFLYCDPIDSMSHRYGPASPQVAAEATALWTVLEALLTPLLARLHGRVLLLLTADHGAVAVDPATTVYLNRQVPELLPLLRTNRKGYALAPAGSARDMFLYVVPARLEEAEARLRERLAGRAEVHRVAELVAAGFFGPAPSAAFLGRVGDLVILPYAGESVWWYERGRFTQPFYGHHGGLTPAEMEIPLLALSVGD